MALNRFHLLTMPLAAASLAFAACGDGDSTAAAGDDRAAFREAALDFAQCMREHGVDMPDPKPDGGIMMRAGPDTDQAAMERSQKACQKHLEKVRPPEISEEQEREFREQALKHAQCMREHGIDMPDPKAGLGGLRGLMTDRDLEGQPGFREVEGDCRKHLEGLAPQISDEQREEIFDARLEFAGCMRDQGFDVPDRQPGGGGGGGPLGDFDLEDPRVQTAMDTCRVEAPSVLDDR